MQSLLLSLLFGACAAGNRAPAPLRLDRAIALPEVEGRIDHLAFDPHSGRLFVAALGNGTVEVVDVGSNKVVGRVTGLQEPQGIVVLPAGAAFAVACGGDGTCRLFAIDSLAPLASIAFDSDADNLRLEPRTGRLFVAHGQALGAVDSKGGKLFEVALASHPEAFQLEPGSDRVFVNVPGARQIAVVDLKTRKVQAQWPLSAGANFPLALAAERQRLYVACRQPARLLAFDTTTGRETAAVDCIGDADDLFYDAARQRLYLAGGDGSIDVFAAGAGDELHLVARVPTAAGARTALLVPERHELFVAVPHRGASRAEIRVFAVD